MLDWMTSFIAETGWLGVAFLMFAENVFPPIPSEIIMPLAGFSAARGEMSLVAALLGGSAGSLAGLTLWFMVGRWIGEERVKLWASRHGRWMTISPRDVRRADAWFERHGGKAVFFGRLIPAVRTLISIPAGVARMGWGRFLLYSGAGTLLWSLFLLLLGYWLESQYVLVERWLSPVSNLVIIVLIIGYVWRVVTFDPEMEKPPR